MLPSDQILNQFTQSLKLETSDAAGVSVFKILNESWNLLFSVFFRHPVAVHISKPWTWNVVLTLPVTKLMKNDKIV